VKFEEEHLVLATTLPEACPHRDLCWSLLAANVPAMAATSASGEKCLDELVAYIERRGPELMSGESVMRLPYVWLSLLALQNIQHLRICA